MTCDGTAEPWTATVTPFSGKFAGGKAGLQYFFSVENEWGHVLRNDTMTVQLRGG